MSHARRGGVRRPIQAENSTVLRRRELGTIAVTVDIELTYVPVADRRASLLEINAAMRRIAGNIESGIRSSPVMLAAHPQWKTGSGSLKSRWSASRPLCR